MTKLKALVAKLERTKLGEQIFRAVRIAGVAIAATAVSGHPVDGAVVAGAFEVAFRQVFPVKV